MLSWSSSDAQSDLKAVARVVVIAPSLGRGGAERSLLRVVESVESVEWYIILIGRQVAEIGHLREGVVVRALDTRARNLLGFARFLYQVWAVRADVVWGWTILGGVWGCLTKIIYPRIRVIYCERLWFGAALRGIAGRRRWGGRLIRGLILWVLRKADVVVANSSVNKRYLEKMVCRERAPAVLLQNALTENEMKRAGQARRRRFAWQQRHRQEAVRIISVGRLDAQKGFDVLIEAVSGLLREAWTLEIFGEGDQLAQLQKLVEGKGLRGRVFFRGWVVDPFEAYAVGDVLVVPSRYEGFPSVVLEGMASGLCVVAAAQRTGVCDVIEDGRTGIIVKKLVAVELGQTLLRVLGDEQLRRKLGRRASRVVREQYGSDKIRRGVEQIWAQLGRG